MFGEVPFSKLFNSAEQTHATSKYTLYVSFSEYPGLVFTVEHNQCSYAHIAFVGNGGRNVDGREVEVGTVTATLVQESREPTISSAPEEAIGSLDAELVPGQSWAVRLEAPSLEPVFYVNGYAICDSEEPFRRLGPGKAGRRLSVSWVLPIRASEPLGRSPSTS